MAQGNWNPDVIKAKPRCRFCNRVVLLRDMVRMNGIFPAHKQCADGRQGVYTVGPEINRTTER